MKADEMIRALSELGAKARISDFTSESEDRALRKAVRVLRNVQKLHGEKSPIWG